MPPPPPDPHWKIGFPRRLAYLLLGVAIGFVLLGVIQSMKRAAMQQQQQPTPAVATPPAPAPPAPVAPRQ